MRPGTPTLDVDTQVTTGAVYEHVQPAGVVVTGGISVAVGGRVSVNVTSWMLHGPWFSDIACFEMSQSPLLAYPVKVSVCVTDGQARCHQHRDGHESDELTYDRATHLYLPAVTKPTTNLGGEATTLGRHMGPISLRRAS